MEVKITDDGSITLFSEQFNQHYHSKFGAKTESDHIFLELGFAYAAEKFENIKIFEMGFGTGLNSWLSALSAEKFKIKTSYFGIEKFPVEANIFEKFPDDLKLFHQSVWNVEVQINDFFIFKKQKISLEEVDLGSDFNLIYYDAFAPEAQPELWTEKIFKKLFDSLVPDGILTTYCSKAYVQRNLKASGFRIEKHPGPPHKREVLRAIKQI
ncbi:MAG: tRNA (5-methylaminomethyl-2-thiouridine)(34)-methyltransferase MnmD [Cytophagaceae bacterium]|nr:tRNA (5-methylaminomethyl-2-thiouridine)(34)-methyltransferase MnmD [Cytophagaceae bacterium]MBL0301791.1 tRNA (5-methylaminomethyl-2-thiouridine)(34)-methyltransferase MnmD [Cytophagaceae bacterium]MBL0324617.1 tRNA (5-methylaminomethyl-2-thiouridine)(34)-methyltransferase MnmD [Cytophagaceae bacterium]